MALTDTKPFPQKIKTGYGVCTAALGSIPAPTLASLKLIATAGPDGAYLAKISAFPQSTVTATGLQAYSSKDNGVTFQPIGSETLAAYTLATTAKIPETVFGNFNATAPKRLEAGEKVYVGIQIAWPSGVAFNAEWMDMS